MQKKSLEKKENDTLCLLHINKKTALNIKPKKLPFLNVFFLPSVRRCGEYNLPLDHYLYYTTPRILYCLITTFKTCINSGKHYLKYITRTIYYTMC